LRQKLAKISKTWLNLAKHGYLDKTWLDLAKTWKNLAM
jgi:hypothetical protein